MSLLHTHSYLCLPPNIFPHYPQFQTKFQLKICSYSHTKTIQAKNFEAPIEVEHYDITDPIEQEFHDRVFGGEDGEEEVEAEEFGGQRMLNEKDYDKDPEFGDIIGSFLDDPNKAKSKMEDRLRKKRHKILHTKTGSPTPMIVKFNKFEYSNSYIWFEFYNALLEKDVSLLSNAIRSWHIIGRLGGCNAMNMQESAGHLCFSISLYLLLFVASIKSFAELHYIRNMIRLLGLISYLLTA
ncbi:hypothetical protein LIER_34211 [Lithospermum erythrorhizon]|uniref:Uncharacterized protein n=1 Tax=Lithospermum erythrorhizon TaxID=34254 RepID=A0AAV3S0R2_LITER